MCLESEFKAQRDQTHLNEWFLFYYFEPTYNSSVCDEGEEGRAGGIDLLVAPNTASYLLSALPESRQADLYSDHPQSKCQNMKGECKVCFSHLVLHWQKHCICLSHPNGATIFGVLAPGKLWSPSSESLDFSSHKRNAQHKTAGEAQTCTILSPLQCCVSWSDCVMASIDNSCAWVQYLYPGLMGVKSPGCAFLSWLNSSVLLFCLSCPPQGTVSELEHN